MSTPDSTTQTWTLPVGPLHVALEEPMYFKLDVDGEIVRNVEITAGHVHRGMEALAMRRNLFQNIVLTERVCSLCSNSHPFTYCMAVEHLAGIEVPARADHLRVVAEEIKRTASHLFNVAILAHIIGFKSLFMHVMEVREIMQDIKETVYGNRMDLAANCIGGVKYDVDAELLAMLLAGLDKVERNAREIYRIYASDPMVTGRTTGIGVLPPDEARRFGVVGPVARGSGLAVDVRRDVPYAAYPQLSFDVITEEGCDVRARALVRLREVFESISIIRQCVATLPEGAMTVIMPEIPAGQSVARSEAPPRRAHVLPAHRRHRHPQPAQVARPVLHELGRPRRDDARRQRRRHPAHREQHRPLHLLHGALGETMHEASIVAGIMRIVEEEAARHDVTRIARVRLRVGLLTGVEPRTLTACFELYSEGTVAEGASLDLETVPALGTCHACGATFDLHRRCFACPTCGNDDITLEGGRELTIAGLEVPQPEGATA